jgi:hypothetical protein
MILAGVKARIKGIVFYQSNLSWNKTKIKNFFFVLKEVEIGKLFRLCLLFSIFYSTYTQRALFKLKLTIRRNLYFVHCRPVYDPPFDYLENFPFNFLSADSENMRKVFQRLWRICGKHLAVFGEYAETVYAYMKHTTK